MNWLEVNGAVLRYDFCGTASEVLILLHQMSGIIES